MDVSELTERLEAAETVIEELQGDVARLDKQLTKAFDLISGLSPKVAPVSDSPKRKLPVPETKVSKKTPTQAATGLARFKR